jgi:HK97 family phage portal protein
LQTTEQNGRVIKERLPDHPLARLLETPNGWQTKTDYITDSVSRLLRYGNYYAFKSAGRTGPVRALEPLPPDSVTVEQADDMSVIYKVTLSNGGQREYTRRDIHHVRLPGTDGLVGESPVMLVREAIATEIAAEAFSAEFYAKGATPSLVFQYLENQPGFATNEERDRFLQSFEQAYGKGRRWRALLLPKGIGMADPVTPDQEKFQFIETRQFQRQVICAAFGVPQHIAGELGRATWANIESQSLDYIQNVILPIVRYYEASMAKDLLSPEDRQQGIICRFNIDGALRGSFLDRQQGLKIQREMGIISADEWREHENMNPLPDGAGGDTVWQRGPSGQTGQPPQGSSNNA